MGLIPVGWAINDDLSLLHRHRDDVKVFIGARAIDAQAGVGLVGGAMDETNQMACIACKKLVFAQIEWHWNVATTVDVGVKFALEVDHKTVDRPFATGQLEFTRGAMRQVGDLGHD